MSIKSIIKSILPKWQTLHLEYPVDFRPRYGHGLPPHQGLNIIIGRNRPEYQAWLERAVSYAPQLATIPDSSNGLSDPLSPSWNNGFLPGLDIAMLYTMIAAYKPSHYIEIGSGNSTKVVAKARQDHHTGTHITSIDPAPRAEIDQLADTIDRRPLEKTDLRIFEDLQPGDIVFVDNSHRVFPNSDAMVFFMEILPQLPKGVVVQVHDVYLPYDYPQDMCDRFYSEQYALAAFLLADPGRYHTVMPCYYISEEADLRQPLDALWSYPGMPPVEKHGGSFWLELKGS